GDPLTPELRHLCKLAKANFLANGHKIATADRQGNVFIWDLPVETKSVDDLRKLARLLSGDTVTPSGPVESSSSPPLSTIWQQLRTKYPSDFTTSPEDIAAWHEFEAENSELQQQW